MYVELTHTHTRARRESETETRFKGNQFLHYRHYFHIHIHKLIKLRCLFVCLIEFNAFRFLFHVRICVYFFIIFALHTLTHFFISCHKIITLTHTKKGDIYLLLSVYRSLTTTISLIIIISATTKTQP